MSNTASIVSIFISLILGLIMAFAGSPGSVSFGGFPLFAICASLGFFLHWFVFGSLWPGISAQEAAYQSIYHGVSAFNNAGFDVLPDVTVGGSSLTGFGQIISLLESCLC